LYFNANVVGLEDVATRRPSIRYVDATGEHAVHCDIVAGCDGFHGISRTSLGPRTFSAFEHEHPFAWLGILAAAPPSTRELIYCRHPRGFALYSMRSPQLSRLYLQVSPSDSLAAWHDERIWEELGTRLDTDDDWALSTGPVIEKSITPMRSFVLQPVQFGSLFLAGDAAHIVPPTGAKGMNLAIADVHDLAKGIVGHFRRNDDSGLTRYSDTCTRRAWRAQDFSMSMTTMLHPSGPDGFDAQLQLSRLGSVVDSPAAARRLAECYVDLCSS
jgi:p-hydroxybenzoate 3-monooxygenase